VVVQSARWFRGAETYKQSLENHSFGAQASARVSDAHQSGRAARALRQGLPTIGAIKALIWDMF